MSGKIFIHLCIFSWFTVLTCILPVKYFRAIILESMIFMKRINISRQGNVLLSIDSLLKYTQHSECLASVGLQRKKEWSIEMDLKKMECRSHV